MNTPQDPATAETVQTGSDQAVAPSTPCYASLIVAAHVRYWEDATVNGIEDTDGSLIPLRQGDQWMIRIDLETGKIHDWPEGTTADIHYKVCDAGQYWLADEAIHKIAKWGGYYVPDDLLAGGKGYGDYIILKVDGAGMIEGWRKPIIDPEEWEFSSHNDPSSATDSAARVERTVRSRTPAMLERTAGSRT